MFSSWFASSAKVFGVAGLNRASQPGAECTLCLYANVNLPQGDWRNPVGVGTR
jgi:hypothetical protein